MNEKKLTVEDAARVCHAANRALCEALGDFRHDSWESEGEWKRVMMASGVQKHMADPKMTPADSHDAWARHMAADGWQHGREFDPDAKTHPCMVPFAQLPLEQQRKDYLFANIIEALRPLVKEQ